MMIDNRGDDDGDDDCVEEEEEEEYRWECVPVVSINTW